MPQRHEWSVTTPRRPTACPSTRPRRLGGAGRRRYPVPAVLLARLAVDESLQGRGLGTRLLLHALGQFAAASRSVGFEVVVVHAIDPDAVTFYSRAGFTRFDGHPLHLFLTTADLLATVGRT